jgi:hypothetical protein
MDICSSKVAVLLRCRLLLNARQFLPFHKKKSPNAGISLSSDFLPGNRQPNVPVLPQEILDLPQNNGPQLWNNVDGNGIPWGDSGDLGLHLAG